MKALDASAILFISGYRASGKSKVGEQGEDIKMENTGPRAVYRAFFRKS